MISPLLRSLHSQYEDTRGISGGYAGNTRGDTRGRESVVKMWAVVGYRRYYAPTHTSRVAGDVSSYSRLRVVLLKLRSRGHRVYTLSTSFIRHLVCNAGSDYATLCTMISSSRGRHASLSSFSGGLSTCVIASPPPARPELTRMRRQPMSTP